MPQFPSFALPPHPVSSPSQHSVHNFLLFMMMMKFFRSQQKFPAMELWLNMFSCETILSHICPFMETEEGFMLKLTSSVISKWKRRSSQSKLLNKVVTFTNRTKHYFHNTKSFPNWNSKLITGTWVSHPAHRRNVHLHQVTKWHDT